MRWTGGSRIGFLQPTRPRTHEAPEAVKGVAAAVKDCDQADVRATVRFREGPQLLIRRREPSVITMATPGRGGKIP
jgi:hypothetical protein